MGCSEPRYHCSPFLPGHPCVSPCSDRSNFCSPLLSFGGFCFSSNGWELRVWSCFAVRTASPQIPPPNPEPSSLPPSSQYICAPLPPFPVYTYLSLPFSQQRSKVQCSARPDCVVCPMLCWVRAITSLINDLTSLLLTSWAESCSIWECGVHWQGSRGRCCWDCGSLSCVWGGVKVLGGVGWEGPDRSTWEGLGSKGPYRSIREQLSWRGPYRSSRECLGWKGPYLQPGNGWGGVEGSLQDSQWLS